MKTIIFFLLTISLFPQQARFIPMASQPGTVAGGFSPEDLNPVAQWIYDVNVTKDANDIVTLWQDNIGGSTVRPLLADTGRSVIATDSSIWFDPYGTASYLTNVDSSGNPFDFGLNDFTIEMWVFPTTGVNYSNLIVDKFGTPGWSFRTDDVGVENRFYFTLQDTAGGLTQARIYNNSHDISGAWIHLAIVLDRNVGCIMYEDGVAVRTENTTEWTNFSAVNVDNTESVYFGSWAVKNMGNVGSIRLYHTALTADDIEDLYDYGIANDYK